MALTSNFVDGDTTATVHAQHHNDLAVRSLTPTAVKTADYTAVAGDLVPVNATSSAITITLPTATAGRAVCVARTDDSAYLVTVVGASGALINGDANATLSGKGTSVTVMADGTNWIVQSAAFEGGSNSGYGAWQTYTPAVAAQTPSGSFSPGTTGGIVGRYREDSTTVEVEVQIKWLGTGIINGGTGYFYVSLPVAAAADLLVATWLNPQLGFGRIYDVSAGIQYFMFLNAFPDVSHFLGYRDGAAGLWGAANPAAPAAGDEATFVLRYRKV